MNKHKRDYVGLSLFVTAVLLTIIFIVMCIKKRNIPAAIAASAALYATGGLWYMSERRYQKCEVCDCFDDRFDPKKKRKDIVHKLTHRRDSLPIYEIPVDNEATEEDFAR